MTASVEITVLALAGLLACIQLIHMAVLANLQIGSTWLAGPRDEPRPLQGRAARMQRAYQNMIEGLVLFGIAVLAVALSGASGALTQACAVAFLVARIVYVPLYATGAAPWRSVVWGVGFLATAVMLIAAATA